MILLTRTFSKLCSKITANTLEANQAKVLAMLQINIFQTTLNLEFKRKKKVTILMEVTILTGKMEIRQALNRIKHKIDGRKIMMLNIVRVKISTIMHKINNTRLLIKTKKTISKK